MKLPDKRSLAATVNGVEAVRWRGEALGQAQAKETARWLAGRQGKPGCYAGMFAPTAADFKEARVFTGEKLGGAQQRHILGEETCRCLRLIGVRDDLVARALERAEHGMLEFMSRAFGDTKPRGLYCCGPCSVGFWRNLSAGGLDQQEARLADGMKELAVARKEDGTWRRFPFYYTLLALVGIDGDLPIDSLRHAAPRCERLLRRKAARGVYDQRRRELMKRVLARA